MHINYIFNLRAIVIEMHTVCYISNPILASMLCQVVIAIIIIYMSFIIASLAPPATVDCNGAGATSPTAPPTATPTAPQQTTPQPRIDTGMLYSGVDMGLCKNGCIWFSSMVAWLLMSHL